MSQVKDLLCEGAKGLYVSGGVFSSGENIEHSGNFTIKRNKKGFIVSHVGDLSFTCPLQIKDSADGMRVITVKNNGFRIDWKHIASFVEYTFIK